MSFNTIHVEIAKKSTCHLTREEVLKKVEEVVPKYPGFIYGTAEVDFEDFVCSPPDVKPFVDSIRVCSGSGRHTQVSNFVIGKDGGQATQNSKPEALANGIGGAVTKNIQYHIYELNDDGEEAEYMDDNDDNDESAASHHWIIPSSHFEGLWESLIFDEDVKARLMRYINTTLLFSEKAVNTNLVSWNKVILLHGPPGTGKTSLCKALAQKAVIRLSHKYIYGQLIEINSHSLFSKWFSESGKLIMKMFDKIHDLVDDSGCLVFLLIDEVESLAQCRQSAEAGNEPSDSIRAVNALLTQIDKIKRYPNVVILTTSNIVGSIDLAFVDRADLKMYIGPPPVEVVYKILATSINELIRVGIIASTSSFEFPEIVKPDKAKQSSDEQVLVAQLLEISRRAGGMSGRTLRKLPFLAHANFTKALPCDLKSFLIAMKKAVEIEVQEGLAVKKTNTALK